MEFINKPVTEDNKEQYIKLCEDNTIINYVASDFEINFPKGYSIQYSASKGRNFAKAYSYPNVVAKNNFEKIDSWNYDFSFIGDSRLPIRKTMILCMEDYFCKKPNVTKYFSTNPLHFSSYSYEKQLEINNKNRYHEVMEQSKFCLCPAGSGQNSIRFFEALAVNSIPIFIGDKRTKFPLDWLIDWNSICFRLTNNDFVKWKYVDKLNELLSLSNDEINNIRKNINETFNKYLINDDEHIKYFESLVLEKIENDNK